MEKNIITKIGTLAKQIKETYSNWSNTTSQTIKDRYCNKLKQQIADYNRLTQNFTTCSKCKEFSNENNTEKYLGYSCCNDLAIYLCINICSKCGKINILKRERVGNCLGDCKPCNFRLISKFPLHKTQKEGT